MSRDRIEKLGVIGLLAVAVVWLAAELRSEKRARVEADERVVALQQIYNQLAISLTK